MKHDSTDSTLNFYRTDPKEEGRLRHFLQQLAKLCRLRGDMIPGAQAELMQKFLLNDKDRHHLQRMSHAYALRAEEASAESNWNVAFSSHLEAWQKMPKDLSLLLDLAEFCIGKDSAPQNSPRASEKIPPQVSEQTEDLSEGQKSPVPSRRKGLRYLKKAVQLSIGLETFNESGGKIRERQLWAERRRLKDLLQSYPQIEWEDYRGRIRALNGRPRQRWPWVLLGLFVFALLSVSAFYMRRWLIFVRPGLEGTAQPEQPQVIPGEQVLLNSPVPVRWTPDNDFEKVIEKSRYLRLGEYYAYEVQGTIRVKNIPNAPLSNAENTGRWKSLRPARPFELSLSYESGGQKQQKNIPFSHGDKVQSFDELRRSPLMEGDTVLFREVFRMDGTPVGDELLRAKINITGKAPETRPLALSEGGFAQSMESLDLQGSEVPTVALAFRDKVTFSDGEDVRLLGYDVELRNATSRPLSEFAVRLSWRDAGREVTPILRSYDLVSASGTSLPGRSRMSQRLWLELPKDLNYSVEDLTPRLEIERSRFADPAKSARSR